MRRLLPTFALVSLLCAACSSGPDDSSQTTGPEQGGAAGASGASGASAQGGNASAGTGQAGSGNAGSGNAGKGGGDAGQAGSGPAGAGGGDAGQAGAGGGDAGQAGAGGFVTAPHPAPPQVLSLGGKVLSAPKVVAITYEIDPHAAEIDKFMDEMGKTSFWSQTTAEYGVGPLAVSPPVHLTTPAPKSLSDAALVQLLQKNLGGASPAWGAPDKETIYVYFAPAGSDVTASGNCCNEYDGYHDEAKISGVSVSYAVVCSCPGEPGLTDIQQITIAASHEMVEAATDPYVQSATAFGQTDDPHAVWTVVSGGEVADMCEYNNDANIVPEGGTYTVQRSWSNAAAKAGKNPCVPVAPTGPYFNSTPLFQGDVTFDYYGPWTTKGLKIGAGQTGTVPLALFSESDTGGPWDLSVYDMGDITGAKPTLSFSLDKASGSNGDTVHLSIKVLSADPQGHPFIVYSERNGQSNLSMGMIVDGS
jgi:hypothetical protein